MKHRASYHDQPKTIFQVIENLVFDLEDLSPATTERDLIIQALLCLLTAVQHERDKRVAAC